MSEPCHVCGPVKHEAPTVLCAPCALQEERSALALRRLEALIPLADAMRKLDEAGVLINRPFIYLGPRLS